MANPFLTTTTSIKNSTKQIGNSPKKGLLLEIESPLNLNYLARKIPRNTLESYEKMLREYDANSAKIRKDLLEMKQSVLPRLSQNLEFMDRTNVKKFLIAERNHKENQRLKRVMSQFLEKVEKNIEKNRFDKMEYEGACEKIFEENEKNYEKMFPKVLESVQIQGNEAFDLNRIKKVRMQHKHKSMNYKKKYEVVD